MALADAAPALNEAYKQHPCHLQRLYGLVTDLYIDKFKFKGLNVKNRVPQLIDELNHYHLPALEQFFETAP